MSMFRDVRDKLEIRRNLLGKKVICIGNRMIFLGVVIFYVLIILYLINFLQDTYTYVYVSN